MSDDAKDGGNDAGTADPEASPAAPAVAEGTDAAAAAEGTPADEKPTDDGAGQAAEAADVAKEPAAPDAPAPKKPERKEGFVGRNFFRIILTILIIEIFIFGKRGELEVCVGKDKDHDFKLLGQPRTDENRARFPVCEHAENLSMVSHYDEVVADAKRGACSRATQLRYRGEATTCVKSASGWQFQVQTTQVWPWQSKLWKSMLHLD